MIRRILKIGAWIVGSALAFCVAGYALAVAINLRDREPSEAAIRLTQAYRGRPALADDDNAYVYAMGFEVAPGDSPGAMGARRIAWMQQISGGGTPHRAQDDPLGKPPELRQARHPAIKEFVEACGPRNSECDETFLASDDVHERWFAAEPWLLERYQALIAHSGWQETVPFDADLPAPAYSLLVDGQRLLLLHAKALARRGDHDTIRKLLDADVRFWREVLKSSDIVLTKMMATAALRRHFRWGNLVLRDAPEAMPPQWEAEITDAERSMRDCLIGEWMFASGRLRTSSVESWEMDLWQMMLARASMPLYQPQHTINSVAAIYEAHIQSLEAPLADYESTLREASAEVERLQREASRLKSPYNVTGKLTIANGGFDFTSYARRVSDIEGIRRAAVVTVRLHEQRVHASEIASALATAPLRNPYNDQPFVWDARRGAVVFTGLEPGERGNHAFRY